MSKFMDWIKATEITATETGVYMKLKDSEILELLIEDYGAKKIGECEVVLSLEEFDILEKVYRDSLVDWS